VPLGGFAVLKREGKAMKVLKVPGDQLPCAHTCFNQLDLPEYQSENELEEKLHIAISMCTTLENS
jgi:E3 ubiquitin-protein ligase HUWE1